MNIRLASLVVLMISVAASAFGPAQAQTTGATAARVLELEDEIRRLNGRIEQLEFQLRRVADDATRRFGDIEFRLTVLEGGDTSLLGDPAPLGQAGGGKPATGPAVAVSERAALDEGLAAVKDGDYMNARTVLEDFMAAYADGPLIGEAEHWLGEAYFRQGGYRRAAEIFLANVENRGDNPMAATSFLHLGLSLERLGHISEACGTFAEAKRRYSGDAGVVEQADAERLRLACP